jgi:hypothetical protein
MTKVEINRIYHMRLLGSSPLYEKGRVLHRRGLDQLEAEMMAFSREWDRDVDGSPNWLPQCGYYATVESDHAHPDRIDSTLACARACDAAFVFATERGGPFTIAYALANAGHDTRRIQD